MSSPRPSVDSPRLLELVVSSGLLSTEQVQDFTARYAAEEWKQLWTTTDRLADEFVNHNLLTRWQADLLLAGKYKGFLLGKYKLLQILGSGGMSSVYLAEHTVLGRRVVIKILPKSLAEDAVALEHFTHSARGVASLPKNNHLIHPLDFDSVGWTYFLVMNYEPGISLQSLVQSQGPLGYLAAANYIAQAADGLDALHNIQMIHCHIDPEHLYLTESGVIKLLGLGVCWSTEADRQQFAEIVQKKLLDGIAGDYQSPEFGMAVDRIGTLSDIYSLGCVFYFLLTGLSPFSIGTAPQRIQQHMWEKIPNVRDERPDAPARLIEILERMLAKNPSDRYASAAALYSDLEAFLRNEGGADELAYVC